MLFAEAGAFQSMVLQAQTLGAIEAAERLIDLQFDQLQQTEGDES